MYVAVGEEGERRGGQRDEGEWDEESRLVEVRRVREIGYNCQEKNRRSDEEEKAMERQQLGDRVRDYFFFLFFFLPFFFFAFFRGVLSLSLSFVHFFSL